MLAKAKSGSPPSCSTLTRRVYFRTKIFCLKKKKKAALLVLFYIIIFTLLYIYVLSGGADDLGTQPYQDPLHLMVNKEDYPNLDVSDDDDNDSEGNVGDSVDLRRQQLREQQQQIQQLRHQLDQQQQPFLLDPRQLPSSTPSTRSPIMYTHSPPSSFKIYVYDLPPNFNLDIARKRPYCERGAFGTGIFIHKQLQQSVYRTHDPEEADLFYIPVYATCLVYIDFGLFEKYRLLIREAIDYVQQKYPYWHRSQGMPPLL